MFVPSSHDATRQLHSNEGKRKIRVVHAFLVNIKFLMPLGWYNYDSRQIMQIGREIVYETTKAITLHKLTVKYCCLFFLRSRKVRMQRLIDQHFHSTVKSIISMIWGTTIVNRDHTHNHNTKPKLNTHSSTKKHCSYNTCTVGHEHNGIKIVT